MQKFAAKHHLPVPVGWLTINAGGTFRYLMKDEDLPEVAKGSYTTEGTKIKFKIEVGSAPSLPTTMTWTAKAISNDDVLFTRDLKPTPGKPGEKVEPEAPKETELEGTWTLRSNGKENAGYKLRFAGETFRYIDYGSVDDPYIGKAMVSMGSFEIDGEELIFYYKKVDGKDVDYKRRVKFVENGTAIIIDSWRFERATSTKTDSSGN